MAILPGIEIGTVVKPGFINVDTELAKQAHGCGVVRFKAGVEGDAETQFMRWAEKYQSKFVVVDWRPAGDDIVVMYTATMSDEEVEVVKAYGQHFTQDYWPEFKKKLDEATGKAEEAAKEREARSREEAEAKQKELERLAELGRKYEKQQKHAKKGGAA